MITVHVQNRQPLVEVDATSDDATVRLPRARTNGAQWVAVHRIDSSGHTVTVTDYDGATVTTLPADKVYTFAPCAGVWSITSAYPVTGGGGLDDGDYGDITVSGSGTVLTVDSGAVAFSELASKPTTLSGYGITDAQPLDTDLTAIAALTTDSFGRTLLTKTDGAAVRSYIGAGTSSFDGAYSSLSGVPSTFAPSGHHTNHESGGSDAIKLDNLAAPDDNTDLDVSTSLHGLVPKAPNVNYKFLRGDATWGFASGWDEWTVKSSDQDVTNSNTLTDCSDLQFSVTAGSLWLIESYIMYSGNLNTSDLKFDHAVSTGTFTGWHVVQATSNTSDNVLNNTPVRDAAVANWTSAVAVGVDSADEVRIFYSWSLYIFSSNATFKMRFAQNTAASSTHARIKQGSIIRGRRMA